jgi:hypothetical protein
MDLNNRPHDPNSRGSRPGSFLSAEAENCAIVSKKGTRSDSSPVIRTVTGDIAVVQGRILAHEHLQIDLSAQKGPANRIGEAEEQAVIEDLRHAKEFGLAAITDLSAPDWGRNPAALRRISVEAGIAVVCAAGFYWDPFPGIAIDGTVERLRDSMIAEIETGVGGTDIRCGVIKVGTTGANRTRLPSGCSERRSAPPWRLARPSSLIRRTLIRRPGTCVWWSGPAWTCRAL